MIERISPFLPAAGAPAALGTGLARPLGAAASQEAPGVDFASLLGDLAVKAAGEVRNAETLSISGVRGQASVQQVVEAVMSAEQALQTAIAVRDKVVSAYLEISRMSI
jgi:flagellar hook-basal body complex protein FliE